MKFNTGETWVDRSEREWLIVSVVDADIYYPIMAIKQPNTIKAEVDRFTQTGSYYMGKQHHNKDLIKRVR